MTDSVVLDTNKEIGKTTNKIWIAVRFIVFGIGGFILMMVSFEVLIEGFLPHHGHLANSSFAILLMLTGSLMMLFGAGAWGRWGYLAVFLALPITRLLLFLCDRWLPHTFKNSLVGFVLILTAPMLISYLVVRRFYRLREGSNR